MNKQTKKGFLYIVTCAARSAEPQPVEDLVTEAQREWDVSVIATPQATHFIDIPLLEKMTNNKVRTEYKRPNEPDSIPKADAIIVFPMTFNTLNKWALGITDTLALGILCEYMGLRKPIVAIPCVPQESTGKHPVFMKNINFLRECGVHVIYNPEQYPPMNNVPWDVTLSALNRLAGKDTTTYPNNIVPPDPNWINKTMQKSTWI